MAVTGWRGRLASPSMRRMARERIARLKHAARKFRNRHLGVGETRSQRGSVGAVAVGAGCLCATYGLTADWVEAGLAFVGMVLLVVGLYGLLTTLGDDEAKK